MPRYPRSYAYDRKRSLSMVGSGELIQTAGFKTGVARNHYHRNSAARWVLKA